MTENKRIVLNMIATYGRSLFTLVCGVFSGRWCLMALGQTDYGLMGVVGGLTVFISFINSWLSYSVSRFYAYSVGISRRNQEKGLEECRRWFSIAVMIHTLVPMALMLVGYPIGEWAIGNWLTIPPERMEACLWVFRFSCVTCFLGMVTIPYTAMYAAKQYIAELTVYSFVTTTLNVCFLYYMVTHLGDWLVRMSLWSCLLGVLPTLIICIRARFLFPECRFRVSHCKSASHLKQLCNFAGWQFFGAIGMLLRAQGIMLLINKAFGPKVNAAMNIAHSLNGHATSLAGSLVGAISPAITSAYGEGNFARMRSLAFRACKFALVLSLVFMLPLLLEVQAVLVLWLGEPPTYTAGLCFWIVLAYLMDVSTTGHGTSILAKGELAAFQLTIGITCFLALPLAWTLVCLGWGVHAVGFALAATTFVHALERVWFARKLTGMSARAWVLKVLAPIASAVLTAGLVGLVPRLFMEAGFGRICLTTILSELVFLPLCWILVLDREERTFVKEKIASKVLARFYPK